MTQAEKTAKDQQQPVFVIEEYELHTVKHRVYADSAADALDKFWSGLVFDEDGKLMTLEGDDSSFLEIADSYGLCADEHPELCEALRRLGHKVDDIIPGIRSVKKVENNAVRR